MNALTDHISAVRLSVQKLGLGKFWIYIIPSVIVFLFYYWFISLFSSYSEQSWFAEVPWIGGYLQQGTAAIISFSSYLFFLFYKFLMLTALSPVNCLLSEKVDNEITGAKFAGGITRIITDLVRALFIVLLALLLNLLVMAIWWILARIFAFHALDQLVYWLIGSFFIGFAFYDYSLERYGVGIFDSWGFGFRNISYMLVTGCLFNLIYMIPILGIIFAPFIVTIVSTIVYLKSKNKYTHSN